MPQFKVRVKADGRTEYLTIMANTQREANRLAIAKAKQLLGTTNVEII